MDNDNNVGISVGAPAVVTYDKDTKKYYWHISSEEFATFEDAKKDAESKGFIVMNEDR